MKEAERSSLVSQVTADRTGLRRRLERRIIQDWWDRERGPQLTYVKWIVSGKEIRYNYMLKETIHFEET